LRTRVVALLLLVGWAALLAAGGLDRPVVDSAAAQGLFDLSTPAAARTAVVGLGTWVFLEVLRFVPLGLLAVFVWPDRSRRLQRGLGVALPALLLAGGVAVVALAVRMRLSSALPGPLDLVLPGVGIALGIGVGLAWRRGAWARVLFLPKLAALAGLLVLLVGGLAWTSLEASPSAPEPPTVDSTGKRQIWAALRGKDPRQVPDGKTRTLTLTSDQIDFVFAWGVPLVLGHDRARVAVSLQEPDHAGAVTSVRVPFTGRWLTLSGSAGVSVEQGRLDLEDVALRLGRFGIPGPLLAAATPPVEVALQNDRRLRPVLAATEGLTIESGQASLTYRRLDTPPGFFARLVWGEEAKEEARAAVAEHCRRILGAGLPRGDARFGAALEAAFASARERSAQGSAVGENRAAILALGILFGHPRLEWFVGEVLDDDDRVRAQRLEEAKLRGRADWPRHYLVSAALTVLSAEAPSNAVGLLKEELDAAGGSGFSFADLLADRAGTTFALAATRDEVAALAIQERLGHGFVLDDFFPEAVDLPEGLQDGELQAQYGGVGGTGYQRVADEIERRVAACAAYRP
jgi:hypothetical protein